MRARQDTKPGREGGKKGGIRAREEGEGMQGVYDENTGGRLGRRGGEGGKNRMIELGSE